MAFTKRIALFIILFVCGLARQGYNQDLSQLRSLAVVDILNKRSALDIPDNKPIVFITLGADCPISQKYIPTLETLKATFQQMAFIGVFPKQSDPEEVSLFIKEYGITFPCYIDSDGQVINLLRAKVTPEAFLLNPELKVLYSGAIDNWFFSLGSYRTNITEHHLQRAMDALLEGKQIAVSRTEAIGCPIAQQPAQNDAGHRHH